MVKTKSNWCSRLSAICLFLLIAGCTLNTHKLHPEFDARAVLVKTPVLIPLDVNMYELSSGGMAVMREDWSSIGCKNLQIAILHHLQRKHYNIKLMEPNSQIAAELAEIRTLYKLVHQSMDQHAFGPQNSAGEAKGFDFSVGSLEAILQKLDADAMIFVSGYDQVSREGRKALIDFAMADSSGTILFYSVKGTTQGKDLRDADSAAALVQDLLSHFSRMEG